MKWLWGMSVLIYPRKKPLLVDTKKWCKVSETISVNTKKSDNDKQFTDLKEINVQKLWKRRWPRSLNKRLRKLNRKKTRKMIRTLPLQDRIRTLQLPLHRTLSWNLFTVFRYQKFVKILIFEKRNETWITIY